MYHGVPPTINDSDKIGMLATIYKSIRIMEEKTFPRTIFIGVRLVVSIISKVCLSISPEIEEDDIIGIIKITMASSILANIGNINVV